jgi:hypothetical protein
MDIPVRQLECCSGDLADLKVKSCDIEAWSPRQQKYFEVCSCSNLGDAQARRLRIRYKDDDGKMQLCHTLNNTCVAPPRMLIALLENNLQIRRHRPHPQGAAALHGRHGRAGAGGLRTPRRVISHFMEVSGAAPAAAGAPGPRRGPRQRLQSGPGPVSLAAQGPRIEYSAESSATIV